MNPLKLSDVAKEIKFRHFNKGLTLRSTKYFVSQDCRYIFDFDVWLPSINMNLQRPLVWTEHQKSEFIISVLKGINIPPISVVQLNGIKDELTRFEVIDGKQRLSTAMAFCRGEFPLIWNGNKYYFKDLDKSAQNTIGGDYYLRFDIAYHYDDEPITDQQKIDWFEMINFTGTPQDEPHLNSLKHRNP